MKNGEERKGEGDRERESRTTPSTIFSSCHCHTSFLPSTPVLSCLSLLPPHSYPPHTRTHPIPPTHSTLSPTLTPLPLPQGIMFGYATDETESLMPLTHQLATSLGARLTEVSTYVTRVGRCVVLCCVWRVQCGVVLYCIVLYCAFQYITAYSIV